MGSLHPSPRIKFDGITRAGMDLLDQRWAIYYRDGGFCQTCGEFVPFDQGEIAHCIANTKANRLRFGAKVIDSPFNKKWTHRGRCNSACNCGNRPDECQKIIDQVEENI
jgi:hypothetical protein